MVPNRRHCNTQDLVPQKQVSRGGRNLNPKWEVFRAVLHFCLTPLFFQGPRGAPVTEGKWGSCSLLYRAHMLESGRSCIKHRVTACKPRRYGRGDKLHGVAQEPTWRPETTNRKFHWVSGIPPPSVRYFSP